MAIRFFDMFAGIGGFRSGLEAVGGFECIGHCEIDKRTNMAYCAIYDTEGEYYCDDARKCNPDEMPDFDLLCAGFPCQSFSVAGKRLGFGDMRGTLIFEVARIVKTKRPSFLLLENVPGLLSHDRGRTFETILSTFAEMGYALEWCVLDSQYFGVPQQRRRLYIVGCVRAECAGQILPVHGGGSSNLRQLVGGPQGQRVYDPDGVACTQSAVSGGWGGRCGLYFIDLNTAPQITRLARCVTAKQDAGIGKHKRERSGVFVECEENAPNTVVLITPDGKTHRGYIRKLMPIECWRLQGYTDEQFNKVAACGFKDGPLYKMAGNSVTVPVISAIGKRIKAVNEKYEIVR